MASVYHTINRTPRVVVELLLVVVLAMLAVGCEVRVSSGPADARDSRAETAWSQGPDGRERWAQKMNELSEARSHYRSVGDDANAQRVQESMNRHLDAKERAIREGWW